MQATIDRSGERGTVMVMVLLLLLPLAMMFGGFALAMHGRDNRLSDEVARERCFWAAEAGVDDASHRAGAAVLTLNTPITVNLGEGLSYQFSAKDLGHDNVDNDGDGAADALDPDEDLLEVHSIGRYRGIEREIAIWLGRTQFLPPLYGAITFSSPATDIRLTGTPQFNGNNYNMNGTLGDPTKSQRGASIMQPGTTGNLLSHLSASEQSKVLGPGGTPSLGTGAAFDVNALADEVRNAANLVLTNNSYSSYSFGNGQAGTGFVTYRNGDLRLAGNTRGAGILVVTGNLTLVGNFRFDGIVIVLGSLDCGAGTADIYGALVMGPNSPNVRATGTFRLRYCDDAIQLANRLSGRYVTFNGWQELAH